jgi:hypothetical protein
MKKKKETESEAGILCATTRSTVLSKLFEKTCDKIRSCYSFTVMALTRVNNVCIISKRAFASPLVLLVFVLKDIKKKKKIENQNPSS